MPIQDPVSISGPLAEDVLRFHRMRGRERLGRLFEYKLDLLSDDDTIAPADVLGKNMTVRLALPEVGERHFNGNISRFSIAGKYGRRYVYRAILRPWLWFLTLNSDCRIFQKQSVPDIIREVFRNAGFTDFSDSLSREYRKWEYCVQYRESDFNFVSRLMEQEGIYYYFRHQDARHELRIVDGLSAHGPVDGYEEIPFFPPDSDAVRERDHIDEWSEFEQVQTGCYGLNDFNFERPRADLNVRMLSQRENAEVAYEHYDYPGEYNLFQEGDAYLRVRMEEQEAHLEGFHGHGNARGLATGAVFRLSGFPREDQNRDYLIVSTYYDLRSIDYESTASPKATRTRSAPSVSCRVTAIDSRQPYRSPLLARKPVVPGPQTAIVAGPAGEEVWTDQYGRVKVQFHWDRYGKRDEDSSCWIRVGQLWSGKHWGGIHIPRIGQEVIVDFLEGDPDRPIITGRVYNRDEMPPYQLPRHATVSTVKSDTSKGGGGFNELRFEDAREREQVMVHAQRRMDVCVRASEYVSVGGNREVVVGGRDQGDLNVLAHHDLNEHTEHVRYALVDKDCHHTVENDVLKKYKGSDKEWVGGTKITTAPEIKVSSSVTEEHLTKGFYVEATEEISLLAPTLKLEGLRAINLKVGSSFIRIDQSGVSIQGIPVRINSGGMAEKASTVAPPSAFDVGLPIDAAAADCGEPGGGPGGAGDRQHDFGTAEPHVPPRPSWAPAPPPIPPRPPAEQRGQLRVCVQDTEGTAVQGADVEVPGIPATGVTDASGCVDFGEVPAPRSYTATARGDPALYDPAETSGTEQLDPGEAEEIQLVLSPTSAPSGRLRVRVVDENRRPVPNVPVDVAPLGRRLLTNERGEADFGRVPAPQRYTATAQVSPVEYERAPASEHETVDADEDELLVIPLRRRPAPLTGRAPYDGPDSFSRRREREVTPGPIVEGAPAPPQITMTGHCTQCHGFYNWDTDECDGYERTVNCPPTAWYRNGVQDFRNGRVDRRTYELGASSDVRLSCNRCYREGVDDARRRRGGSIVFRD